MIRELYEKLNSESFQSHHGVAYNFHIVPYNVREEKRVFEDIAHVVEDIRRPTDFIDILSIDLFGAFLEHLAAKPFGRGRKLRDHLLAADAAANDEPAHANISRILSREAHDRAFLDFVFDKVKAHFGQPQGQLKRPYVFFYGIGQMYPYLRANEFLTAYEKVNDASRYRVILFYPGTMRNGMLSLFGLLDDRNTYRAQILEI